MPDYKIDYRDETKHTAAEVQAAFDRALYAREPVKPKTLEEILAEQKAEREDPINKLTPEEFRRTFRKALGLS